MAVRILGAARHRILDIWDYTAIEWSEDQADSYVRGLVDAIMFKASDIFGEKSRTMTLAGFISSDSDTITSFSET